MIWLNDAFRADQWSWSSICMIISSSASAYYADSALYPDSGLAVWQLSIPRWYWQWSLIPTVVYILTVVSSLSDYSPQHIHCYLHVIFNSAYPAVRVKIYAYVNMLGINDLITTICWKESSQQACNYAKGRNQRRNNANDSFGKGFHVLKDHVPNRLMNRWCPRTSLQLRPKFHSLLLQNSFDFKKSATFKELKLSPRMYWCKFQPWKRVTHSLTVLVIRHGKVTDLLTLSRMRAG